MGDSLVRSIAQEQTDVNGMGSDTCPEDRDEKCRSMLTLRFDPESEREFQADYCRKTIRACRFAMLLVLLVTVFFGYAEIDVPLKERIPALGIRFGILCPCLLLLLASTYLRSTVRYLQPAMAMTVVVCGTGLIGISAIGTVNRHAGVDQMTVTSMLTLMVGFTLVKLQFWPSTLAGVTVALICMGMERRLGVPHLLWNSLMLTTAGLFGMTACFTQERYNRREFVLTRQLKEEQARSERLLLNILPGPIAERLKRSPVSIADSFAEVTVLFADIVDFTPLSARITPTQVVELLNRIFSAFDALAERHGLEKIKTIGDAYMAVGGLPEPRSDHAAAIADLALEMREAVTELSAPLNEPLRLRIGLHIGPAVAGVIGAKKFIYDLWGDTVNLASRMQTHGEPDGIMITSILASALEATHRVERIGTIPIKGRGLVEVWRLVGRKP